MKEEMGQRQILTWVGSCSGGRADLGGGSGSEMMTKARGTLQRNPDAVRPWEMRDGRLSCGAQGDARLFLNGIAQAQGTECER